MATSLTAKKEFGDFQTPGALARRCCALLLEMGVWPKALVEPTCGTGEFLTAALESFPEARNALGFDINAAYVAEAATAVEALGIDQAVSVCEGDFFEMDWPGVLGSLPSPVLVIGNPPWVTNSDLGQIRSSNLPTKSNFQNRRGFDAITGKSNFDISEWMLIRLIEVLGNREACLAMLCKTAVARKALLHSWKERVPIASAQLHHIDAAKHFGAAVDACFLVVRFDSVGSDSTSCVVFDSLSATANRVQEFGYRDSQLVADVVLYSRRNALRGTSTEKVWRSGVKHDCSRVMELVRDQDGRFHNGLGTIVELESTFLYPMLKSSQVASDDEVIRDVRWMLVTQQSPSDSTETIEKTAPKTWRYLTTHAEHLDKRGSSIYRKRPRFSVFGVGDYSFAPWKVAISGFYKKLRFRVIGPHEGKPIVLDDTSYFLPCESEEEARSVERQLLSEEVQEFFRALVFWDSKRPITAEMLNQLRLDEVALTR